MPQTTLDLVDHKFIGTSNIDNLCFQFNERNINLTPKNFVASSNSGAVMWKLAKAGIGICVAPKMLGNSDLDIEEICSNLININNPTWLVTHQELKSNKRIRIVFDFIANKLKAGN